MQAKKIFQVLGAPLPDPQWPSADGDGVTGPWKQPLPPLQNSGYAPYTKRVLLIHPSFGILRRELIDLVKEQPPRRIMTS